WSESRYSSTVFAVLFNTIASVAISRTSALRRWHQIVLRSDALPAAVELHPGVRVAIAIVERALGTGALHHEHADDDRRVVVDVGAHLFVGRFAHGVRPRGERLDASFAVHDAALVGVDPSRSGEAMHHRDIALHNRLRKIILELEQRLLGGLVGWALLR